MTIRRSISNALASGGAFLWSAVLAFIVRAEFVRVLGVEWLGIDALFASIIVFVSLTELGIGSAVTFAFFKPLNEGDHAKIWGLMAVLSRFYRWIILGTLLLGGVACALLPYLSDVEIGKHEYSLFGLFVVAYSTSYVFAEYKVLALAMQKNYLESAARVLLVTVKAFLQLAALEYFESYGLFLASVMLANVLSNLFLRHLVRLKFGESLSANTKAPSKQDLVRVRRNIIGGVLHRFSSAVVTGTDNILISIFVGITTLGLYSSYSMLVQQLSGALGQLIYPLAGIIGGVNANQGGQEAYRLFKVIFLGFSYFVSVAALGIAFCIDDVIHVWLGDTFVLPKFVGILLAVNFFVIVLRRPAIISIDAFGFQWDIRHKAIVEAAVNAVASLVFIMIFDLGVIGVIAGTLVSNLATNVWWEPLVIYRGIFRVKLRYYFAFYVKAIITVFITATALMFLFSEAPIVTSIWQLLVKVATVWIVASVVFIAMNASAFGAMYTRYRCRL
ncbi:lipopolysaccharide biosynthesis protein [Pseudophaeobacter sp. TrK17]|uniref:lipopolysaccharide biosynthesis protein n=1 Tax=Pseudophaeobacter sp. TrK17 TaxID=2815167 RepID=UPI0035D03CEF